MPLQLQAERQARLVAVARRQLAAVRQEARRAEEGRQHAAEAAAKQATLREANQLFTAVDMHRATIYLTVVLGMLAVYFLDVVLFAPVADFFVQQNFPEASWFAVAARFMLPAAILFLEVLISVQHGAAVRDRLEGLSGRQREVWWATACVVLSLVMPAAVVATYLAGEEEFTPWISGPLVVALAGLSLLAHLSVLFGGRLAAEAKSYYVFRMREHSLSRRIKEAGRLEQRHGRAAADLFGDYYQTLDRHNQEFPGQPLQAGPFDLATRDAVNRVYGYEVIRTAGPASPLNRPFTPPSVDRDAVAGSAAAAPQGTNGVTVLSNQPQQPAAWHEAAMTGWRADEHEVRA